MAVRRGHDLIDDPVVADLVAPKPLAPSDWDDFGALSLIRGNSKLRDDALADRYADTFGDELLLLIKRVDLGDLERHVVFLGPHRPERPCIWEFGSRTSPVDNFCSAPTRGLRR